MCGSDLTLTALFCAATVCASNCYAERVPLRWLWNDAEHDSAYTISEAHSERLVRERGYKDMGTIAYVEATHVAHSYPLRCFYAPRPRTDTFCSTSRVEQRIVQASGYGEVGVEGYVLDRRLPGTVPLYRVSRIEADSSDYEHRFVISADALVRPRERGWVYDGSKGYVYPGP